MQDFEQLGQFYLGRAKDPKTGAATDDLVLYDSKDLTTHAVIVGMTGSGKTGLGITIIEEAAIDGVPSIVIDPKGDLGNLRLAFPNLDAKDFDPWIDAAEAQGSPPGTAGAKAAKAWRDGLAKWGEDGARIGRYLAAAEATIYTPGSHAGVPISVLESFAPPAAAILEDADAFRECVTAAASGVLGLARIDADPIRSREHVLVSTILERAWREGRTLDLGGLIQQVQAPPFEKIGVLDLESAFPSKDRFALAMALNGILASPGFSAWIEGEPLDIQKLLWTAEGKPRIAIMSIAHLADAERMFFVTALLNEVVGWMRAQPGTASLRALLYMDEVFGFFPPTANPPSKIPMLTLLKQARAFGLGIVLATQNPVDLDYKGLGNAGTWLLGRLQTERDKMRVLDGLEGASAAAAESFDRKRLDGMLSGLQKRTFLMANAHESAPVLFETRWTLSYLRGPLTRAQIQSLTPKRAPTAGPPAPSGPGTSAGTPAAAVPKKPGPGAAAGKPALGPGITEVFVPLRGAAPGARVEYRASILGTARVRFKGSDAAQTVALLVPVPGELDLEPWARGLELPASAENFASSPEPGVSFSQPPAAALKAKSYEKWSRALRDHLVSGYSITQWTCESPEVTSRPGETEGEFRSRVALAARETRDAAVEKIRQDLAPKAEALQARIRTIQDRVERKAAEVSSSRWSMAGSFGSAVLGVLFGRKIMGGSHSGRFGRAMQSSARTDRAKEGVAKAEESLESIQQKLADLSADAEAQMARVRDQADPAKLEIESERVSPKKTDVTIGAVVLAWAPWAVAPDGTGTPAFERKTS